MDGSIASCQLEKQFYVREDCGVQVCDLREEVVVQLGVSFLTDEVQVESIPCHFIMSHIIVKHIVHQVGLLVFEVWEP